MGPVPRIEIGVANEAGNKRSLRPGGDFVSVS